MTSFNGIALVLVGSIPAAAESTVTKVAPVEKEVAISKDLPLGTTSRKAVANGAAIGAGADLSVGGQREFQQGSGLPFPEPRLAYQLWD